MATRRTRPAEKQTKTTAKASTKTTAKAATSNTTKKAVTSSTPGKETATTSGRRRSIKNALVVAPDSAIAELEPLRFNYSEIKDKATQTLALEAAREIKQEFKRTLVGIIRIGRWFLRVREKLPNRTYMKWVQEEFEGHISYDTANNWVNVAQMAEKYTPEELEKLPLSTLYNLSRGDVPSGAVHEILALAEVGEKVDRKRAGDIVERYRQHQMEAAGLPKEVQQLLISTDLAEDRTELSRLAKLPVRRQLEVAPHLLKGLTVKEALNRPREDERRRKEEEILEAEVVSVAHQRVETFSGKWSKLLSDLPLDSVDLCFAEMPLGKASLVDYKVLAEILYPRMKDGGVLLAVCGQQNIQFVGPQLDPFHVGWTYTIRRQPGYSPRIVGRATHASSHVLLSMSYKPPLRLIRGLIDDFKIEGLDLESEEYQHAMNRAIEDLLNNPTAAQKSKIADAMRMNFGSPAGIENSIEYYLQRFINPTDTFVHLITDRNSQFEVHDYVREAVLKCGVDSAFTLIGR
jgi:hypothetical protein